MSIILQLLLTFGLLSLLSIGGANATLPEIHRQVVDQLHWMDDATFVNLVAIGQAAPGPNVLIVSLIGWQAAGLAGLFAATFAIILPSSTLAIAVSRFMARHEARGVRDLGAARLGAGCHRLDAGERFCHDESRLCRGPDPRHRRGHLRGGLFH